MADLALGLAKSTVVGTVSMVKSEIEKDKKLKKSVKRDLMLISDEFEMMHSFLNVAKDHTTDEMVRTLVSQVRNMALDVEDCIESGAQVDHKKSTWWRSKLPSRLKAAAPAVALNEAVESIELLKARVEAMGQRNMRYSHISGPSSKSDVKMHQPTGVVNATAFDILLNARSDMMKQRGLVDLVKLISKKDSALERQVISVWGTASNFGMASIVKKAYDEPEISKNYSCRAWVKVMQPFNPHEFIRNLLIQFYTNYCPQQGRTTVDFMKPMKVMESTKGELIEEFTNKLSNQIYLIVLEDLSSVVDWDIIREYLPSNNNGSCIIVATQQLEIASMCIGHSYQVSELKKFSDDHSVCVFFKEEMEEYTPKRDAATQWLHKFKHVAHKTDLYIIGVMAVAAANVAIISGVAGVGKSFLVRTVYYHAISEGRFQKFGWVNVSHPFNLVDLSRRLLLDLHSESLNHYSTLRIEDPIQACREFLDEHKCLVVIDGLRSKEEWDLTKAALTFAPSGSRVIVITDEESVAAYCATPSTIIWNVKVLEADDALELFKEKVREKTCKPYIDDEVISQAKLVLHKCGGLPKVIVSVADYYASESQRLSKDLLVKIWKKLSCRFMQELETNRKFDCLRDLFAWVHSYFRTCPDFLKPCIFYLSIFPENRSIRRRRFVRRWIAEGYSRDTKESTAEENGENFFSKLVKLSMIQVLDATTSIAFLMRMPLCQVNGFFREYIISRSMEENLVFALEGSCSLNPQRTGRHLTIHGTWDRDRIVFESMDFSRLRSLTVFGKWDKFFISEKMKLLRVLDLEDAEGVTDGDVDKMVKLLRGLKFLSLRGCSGVSCLPDSLGGLRLLQTLDVRNTKVSMIPSAIIELKNLQYVRVGTVMPLPSDEDDTIENPPAVVDPSTSLPAGTQPIEDPSKSTWSRPCCMPKFFRPRPMDRRNSGGVTVPRGIQGLVALHTLGVVDVGVAEGKAILEEIKKLSQLHKLGVCGINQNNSKELCGAVSGHIHLESLLLGLNEDCQGCLDGISSVPPNLHSLKLCGPARGLPEWINQLQNLKKLNLQMITLPQDSIDVLGGIPGLQFLHLSFKEYQDGKLHFEKGFNALYVLKISCNNQLRDIRFLPGVLRSLEMLKIHFCPIVSLLRFSGLKNLEDKLKKVTITGSCTYPCRQRLKKELVRMFMKFEPPLDDQNCNYNCVTHSTRPQEAGPSHEYRTSQGPFVRIVEETLPPECTEIAEVPLEIDLV